MDKDFETTHGNRQALCNNTQENFIERLKQHMRTNMHFETRSSAQGNCSAKSRVAYVSSQFEAEI